MPDIAAAVVRSMCSKHASTVDRIAGSRATLSARYCREPETVGRSSISQATRVSDCWKHASVGGPPRRCHARADRAPRLLQHRRPYGVRCWACPPRSSRGNTSKIHCLSIPTGSRRPECVSVGVRQLPKTAIRSATARSRRRSASQVRAFSVLPAASRSEHPARAWESSYIRGRRARTKRAGLIDFGSWTYRPNVRAIVHEGSIRSRSLTRSTMAASMNSLPSWMRSRQRTREARSPVR